jgi:site-specific recombinase XerD
MLRKHRTEQKAERLRAGNQWQETGLVFTTEFGRSVDSRSFLRVKEDAAEAAGVQGVGAHTLRHFAAVGWLEAGVHVKAVADMLGHSSIAITGASTGRADSVWLTVSG